MSILPAPATAPLADGPPAPGHGWTPALKARFLDRLAAHGNARAACRNVGLSAEAAYKLRRRDPLFARGWAAALLLARDNGAQVLAERAIEGVEEPIYYRGELIGTRRRYDNRLLLAHLARLDRLADEAAAGEDAGRFDEVLAAIADGASPLPEREAFIEAEIEAAQERHRRDALDAYYAAADAAETARAAAADGLADFDEEDEVEEAEDFFDRLSEECREIAGRVRAGAAERWDRRRGEAFAVVDALNETPPPAEPRLPPALAALVVSGAEKRAGDRDQDGGDHGGGVCFPCTPSTVSTSALARALCDPPPGMGPTPRSPFTAPRGPGSNAAR